MLRVFSQNLLIVLLFGAIGLNLSTPLSAYPEPLSDLERIEASLSTSLKVPNDHPLFNNLREAQESGTKEHTGRAREADQKPLIKQIKFGQGSPFSSTNNIPKPKAISKEEATQAAKRMLEEGLAQYKELAKLEPISECESARTEYTSMAELNANIPPDIKAETTIDYIFVTPTQLKRAEGLTKRAIVKVYDYKSKDSGSYAIKMMAPPCLPFRIRQTSTQIFYHLGDDALIDY